ncbi:acetolactate synthase, large subunit [Maricaulis salignorans]|uniref:Acetolactate synthase n=2 Tax=Maricaulis salignorans TaxID=144026 RepID=A0A1G9WDQ3_9PROT|nr:acetolactate synthase 2 catalytic subunit [Maricaulis salignorans]SDM82316.1 acetolactate synthase, large subunit [Maricaulis salignorans]
MTMLSTLPKTETTAQERTRNTGAHLVVRTLEKLGVTRIFGYPGGAIMPVYDALTGSSLQHVLVRHEQAAAFAADAQARITGKAGVCLATSGPGATNLLTGIANAYMDSVPMVILTGQVPSGLMGTDAFQEVDVFGMTLPVVKHSIIIRDANRIPELIEEAFRIAEEGRPGPVLIDLPKDVLQAEAFPPSPGAPRPAAKPLLASTPLLDAATVLLAQARRPVLYIGGGVGLGGAIEPLRDFMARTGIPAVATLKGLGTPHPDALNFLGMLGMHGTRTANMAVNESDLLVCVGARFDDRATGKPDTFAPDARIIHIDGDPAEIGKLRWADVAMNCDIADALTRLDPGYLAIEDWRQTCAARLTAFAFDYDAPGSGIFAPALLKQLSEAAGDKFIAACDVGQHQMWVAQHCRFAQPSSHLTSAGLGAMGYGLPAGIGAAMERPDMKVVTITGDGSIMMNIQELATARRYGVPIRILLLDNGTLGLVRQWQEYFFEQNFSEIDLYDNPDFAEVARAFGVESFTVHSRDEVPGAIDRLLRSRGPILAHVLIDPRENVWPLVPPGASNADMMEN